MQHTENTVKIVKFKTIYFTKLQNDGKIYVDYGAI